MDNHSTTARRRTIADAQLRQETSAKPSTAVEPDRLVDGQGELIARTASRSGQALAFCRKFTREFPLLAPAPLHKGHALQCCFEFCAVHARSVFGAELG